MLFGATGDLAKRKLFPALYHLERTGPDVPVIGVARSGWTDDDFRDRRPRVDPRTRRRRGSSGDRLAVPRLDLIQGDYADEATWDELESTLRRHGSDTAVFYMAIPPSMFPMVARSWRRSV